MSSFQGPGTGISGTSNQFSVGYAQSSGYSNGYAQSAGNINGYAPQAGYANQSAATAANIQSMQGMNGTSWAWAGQNGTPGHLWGGNVGSQYAVWQYGQMYAAAAGYATYAGSTSNINGYATVVGYANQLAVQGGNGTATTWAWAGQGGTPGHFWGSNDGAYMAVWQYAQMVAANAGYVNNTPYANISGYTNITANQVNTTQYVYPNTYNFGNIGVVIYGSSAYNGNYTGVINTLFIQGGNFGAFFNFKRSTGGNSGDRFVVYYNPENNGNQYGYWNGGWGNVSDAREKDEIADITSSDAIKFIKELRPRKFRLRNSDDGKLQTGFIAQEVLSVAPSEEFLHIVNNGQKYLDAGASLDISNLDSVSNTVPGLGLSLENFVSPLVKTVQALMDDMKVLQDDVTELESRF